MRPSRLAILLALGLAGCQTNRDGVAINLTALSQVLRHPEQLRPAQIDWFTQALGPAQHNDLGVLYEREGRLDDAARQYNLAILKDPGFAKAYVNLGNARRKQGRNEEALVRYREAMSLEPGNFAGVNNFADLCAELGQHLDEAITRLTAALKVQGGSNPYGLDTLGWLYHLAGQSARGLPMLESAAGLAATDRALAATVRCHLALLYAALGRRAEAVAQARQARELGLTPRQSAELQRVLGGSDYESGRP